MRIFVVASQESSPLGLPRGPTRHVYDVAAVSSKIVTTLLSRAVLPSNTGVVQLSNCAFWGKFDRAALIAGEGSVSLSQCNFQHWDFGKRGLPAIEAVGGDVIVQGCQFLVPLKQIVLGEGLKTAIVQGNRFRQIEVIENKCKGDAQIGMNVVRKGD